MGFDDLIEKTDDAARRILGGVSVTYTPTVGDPVIVTGVFDREHVLVDPGDYNRVEMVGPAVWLDLDELTSDPETDDPTITVDSVDYIVRARQKDSIGNSILLMLHLASVQ